MPGNCRAINPLISYRRYGTYEKRPGIRRVCDFRGVDDALGRGGTGGGIVGGSGRCGGGWHRSIVVGAAGAAGGVNPRNVQDQ